jgi:DNA polymerase
MDCEKCQKIVSTRKNIVFQEIDREYKGIIVAESPTKREDRTGKFSDPYWNMIKDIMKTFNSNIEDFYITAAIKCYPGSNRFPEAQEIQNCSNHFSNEVQKTNPSAILFLGEYCAKEYIKEDIVVNRRYETSFCKNVIVSHNPKSIIEGSPDFMKFKSIVKQYIRFCLS